MAATGELQGVEIVFWADWYDGPVSGVARYRGREHWFEAEPEFYAQKRRMLHVYPLTDDELAREKELDRIYEEQAKGKPVEEWPSVLRERDFELPSAYAERESLGWFSAS
jgi:hypothetical protein